MFSENEEKNLETLFTQMLKFTIQIVLHANIILSSLLQHNHFITQGNCKALLFVSSYIGRRIWLD
jgi:hypothetical protein